MHNVEPHFIRVKQLVTEQVDVRYERSNELSVNASPLLSLIAQRTFLCRQVGVERTTQIGPAGPTMPTPSEAESDGLTHPSRGTLKRQIAPRPLTVY